ncbi:MAG: LON peptidase substrate-binding domain-containing protein [Rhodospirillales bacterium]|nr:LON peptidase substrate-binding domain-containing protein [Rhodospirillales bacterium]MCB9997288.1 LON peptidase substrate-binding domain-containing protein [Rhodospirillales bacterium]
MTAMAAGQNPDQMTLPDHIPVFPLSGVLLLPSGHLPLNIFEPRYIAMVDDCLKGERLIGMIQPRENEAEEMQASPDLFDVGCAGRITAFEETEDGRYLITLTGISRFKITEELPLSPGGYRQVAADWGPYEKDRALESCLGLDRDRLRGLLEDYFHQNNLSCEWETIEGAVDQKLVTCLSMICPFGPNEKQALLEAGCCHTRAEMFMTMLEMAIRDGKGCCGGGCH